MGSYNFNHKDQMPIMEYIYRNIVVNIVRNIIVLQRYTIDITALSLVD